MKRIARIFEECTGLYHICEDVLDCLDARGRGYKTKIAAMRAARDMYYTHARGSGTYHGNNLTDLSKLN